MSTKPALSRLTLACALALLASGPGAQAAAAGDFEDYQAAYQRARAAVTQHDDEAARPAYLEAIAKLDALGKATSHGSDGVEAAVYMELGAFEEQHGRTQDAENEFQLAVQFADSSGRSNSVVVALFSSQHLAALYFRNGDYHRARDAAQGALQHLGSGGFSADRTAEEKLKAQLVIAKCDAAQGLPQLAKTEFDELWKLADGMRYIAPETANDLLDSSTHLYRQLHLDQLADATVQRAQLLEQKRKASYTVKSVPTITSHPPTQQSAPEPVDSHATKPPSIVDMRSCLPDYPRTSRLAGEQGTVTVLLKVSQEGKLTDAVLVTSSDHPLLDQATLNAFHRCLYRPATKDGEPVASEFKAIYQWKLE